jgi:uncharacterized membrane protein YgdD (TMEM256/DUF423 family)
MTADVLYTGPVKPRWIPVAGALLAALGVTFGAFGAHALRDTLDPVRLGWWNTAVLYQMWHAVGLIAIAGLPLPGRSGPAMLLAAGTIIFSGTLYIMALTGIRWLGAITPIGGLLMIAGWTLLAWRTLRQPQA